MDVQKEDLTEALSSIHSCFNFHVRDWAANKRDAWTYGIVVGWSSEAYAELAEKFNWSANDIQRNKRLHNAYKATCEI